ncbi:hypothetical protein NEF87_000519 [Candidatus Lokiarchaeum ossiferum]|uniref:DUF2283 domain-containing protein n=1 Tax=Candidatus Lokiarchaeum ossiferum TaxID=2951803 RepID=A0ABY6HP39_9ARCH|nr:hypothetical protein NEF87_000519 [Candidatus Lokiarchaeum sp. B-35]
MNKFIVKLTYQNGESEEKILEYDAISKITNSISLAEPVEGRFLEKMTILQPI